MSIAIVGEHLIHYEAIGRGEPIIFIHGWVGSWRYWWPSMQALARQHRTFAYDICGFGDSSKDPNTYSLDRAVEMLDQFITRLGIITPPTLVGHTLGAAVALRFAGRHPEKIKRLIGVSLPLFGAEMHDRLLLGNLDDERARVVGRAGPYPEIDSEVHKTDPRAIAALAAELKTISPAQEFERCPVPVLLVFGEQDPVIPPPAAAGDQLTLAPKRQRIVTLPNSQHFPMLERPAQFNRLVHEFMRANGDLSSLSPKEYWQRRTF